MMPTNKQIDKITDQFGNWLTFIDSCRRYVVSSKEEALSELFGKIREPL